MEYFPLDYDALKKGDVIATERIEEFAQIKRDSPKFQLALLDFKSRVEKELWSRDKCYTLKISRGQIRILTDEEAVIYNRRQCNHGFRRARRSYKRMINTDKANLNEIQKQDHERDIITFGRMLLAAARAKKTLMPEAHIRSVPGLPPKETVVS